MFPHPVYAVALRARHPCHSYNNVLWPLIGRYVKEGLVMAPHHTNDLAPLLRYESSKLDDGMLTSLAEYPPALHKNFFAHIFMQPLHCVIYR